jgi:hypothetical protein
MELIDKKPRTLMPYDKAIDTAFILNKDDDEWRYHVQIDAKSGKASIAVYDETDYLVGYL